jgi:hypothetical protein
LRALWRHAPAEGDKFVTAEIDWQVTTSGKFCVQFALSGNSPVAFSQIVALAVDNSRNGSDVTFIFPDSASTLVVPAQTSGVFPVFTNALMFYVSCIDGAVGDATVFTVHNSMPPPVVVTASAEQERAGFTALNLAANGNTVLIPATVSGTLQGLIFQATLNGGAAVHAAALNVQDGSGATLWVGTVQSLVSQVANVALGANPIRVRFVRGLSLNVAGSSFTGTEAFLYCNAYYGIP